MNCSATYKLTAALVSLVLMMPLSTSNVHASESTPSGSFKFTLAQAEHGDASAQFNLGILYATGEGVDQSYSEAAYWFRKAAEKDNKNAQFNLGILYATGNGVDQDDSEAVYWYRKAAEDLTNPRKSWKMYEEIGHPLSQLHVGNAYFHGQGIAQNHSRAVYWYQKAAVQGIADAQFNLASCHYNGDGVPPDAARAWVWYSLAADHGYEGAVSKRDSVYSELSGKQSEQALTILSGLKAIYFPYLLRN